jgi:hypothetical protein
LVRHSSQAIPKSMMPIIHHEQQTREISKAGSAPNTRISSPTQQQKHKLKESSTPTKRLKIKARASSFFSKLLSQSNVGASSNGTELKHQYCYSFVPRDDNPRPDTVAPAAVAGRSIGRSLSLGSLFHSSRGRRSHEKGSLPLSSTPKSVPGGCMISREIDKSSPTSSSQLREDSEASLLTVIDGGMDQRDREGVSAD